MLTISDEEFEGIQNILHQKTGVMLRSSKKTLVLSRLRKRLGELKKERFEDYIALLKSPENNELEYFINALTTNETFFFRHTNQFNFLYERALPETIQEGRSEVSCWSAACSTGEEPYSIAIAFMEFFKNKPGKKYSIYASDINTQVIKIAKEGVYSQRSLKEVPQTLNKRYFDPYQENPKDPVEYKIKDHVKRHVNFFQHNLKTTSPKENIDLIFLRNVLIYFERDVKQLVVQLIEKALKPNGYFFISLSENLNDIQTSLKLLKGGIYQKKL